LVSWLALLVLGAPDPPAAPAPVPAPYWEEPKDREPFPLQPPKPTEVEIETRWYGYKILSADLIGLGISMFGVGLKSYEVASLGFAVTFVSPLIHGAHGRPVSIFTSYALRIAGIVLGYGFGLAVGSAGRREPYDAETEKVAGSLGGLILAELIDIAFFAYEPVGVRAITPVIDRSGASAGAALPY
jgi:hypothetical protein